MEQQHSDHAVTRAISPIGPRGALWALAIAAALCGLWMIQFENLNLLGLSILVFFFAVTIGLKRSWALYLLFGTLIFYKSSVVEPWDAHGLRTIGSLDVVFTFAAILFAGLCFRYLELSRVVEAFFPALPKSATKKDDLNAKADSASESFPSLLGGRWWLIPIAILFAIGLLQWFPYDGEGPRQWITASGKRIIHLTFFLFVSWFLCRTLLAMVLRWNLGPEQASIRSRSLIAKEFWNESYPIERKRGKIVMDNRAD